MQQKIISLLEEHGLTGGLILLAILARLLMDREPITIVRVVRLAVSGVLVGALVSLALADTSYSETTRGAIIGVSALLSEDVIIGALAIGKRFSDNPHGVVDAILKRWRS